MQRQIKALLYTDFWAFGSIIIFLYVMMRDHSVIHASHECALLAVLGYTVILEYSQVFIIVTSSQLLGLGFAAHLRSPGTGHVVLACLQ